MLLAAGSAQADSFVPLPQATGASKHLKVRFVEYRGGTNGQMVIQVKNTSKSARTFRAEGMFFVPMGDAEKAPQRLGAAGQFLEMATSGKESHKSQTKLAPGQTKELRLEVFCIDSHRSSPSTSTKFRIAKKVLPKKLRQELSKGARSIVRSNKGKFSASKSAIQSHMWKTRNKKWVALEGERVDEKSAKKQRLSPMEQRRRPFRNKRQMRQVIK